MESSYKKEIYKAWMNIVIMQKGLLLSLGIIWTLKSVIGCPDPKKIQWVVHYKYFPKLPRNHNIMNYWRKSKSSGNIVPKM